MEKNQEEKKIIAHINQYNTSKPSDIKQKIVTAIRHLRMDSIIFDHKDNDKYFEVYSMIMMSISCDYPFLSGEVQRQIDKKIRWQNRRTSGKGSTDKI